MYTKIFTIYIPLNYCLYIGFLSHFVLWEDSGISSFESNGRIKSFTTTIKEKNVKTITAPLMSLKKYLSTLI